MGTAGPIATNMVTPPMRIDPSLLTLTQWMSPSYPLGAFAFSHGLEAACAAGWVSDNHELEQWLSDVITDGSGWSDAVWIAAALKGERSIQELDALARAYCASAERLREAERQGAAFARVTSDVWGLCLPTTTLPIALGHASALKGLEGEAVISLYLQGIVANLVSGAQRLMPLGQTDAQRIVARLGPHCIGVASKAIDAEVPWSNTFFSDIAAMAHETLEPRIFQS